MLDVLRSHRLLVIISVTYALLVWIYLWGTGQLRFFLNPIWSILSPIGLTTFTIVTAIVVFGTPGKYRRSYEWKHGLLVFVLVGVVAAAFRSAKLSLIWTVPYTWDPWFAKVDATLHGGRDPWYWLVWIVDQPVLLRTVDAIYVVWLPLQLGVTYAVGWQAHSQLRMRYLLTYALLWIVLGSGGAAAFGSVGPCFYREWTGEPRFVEFMQALHESGSLTAVQLQKEVWAGAMLDSWSDHGGVSAMPSLHLAITTLLLVYVWAAGGHAMIRTCAVMFWVAIQVGSVALGWHYAIDGYVATVSAVAIWYAVGACQTRAQPAVEVDRRRWPIS